jgi:UDP-N-acetylbacillosamine N-acetyltransferase
MKFHLIIWGSSGHAKVVCDIVRLSEKYTVFGFLDNVNIDRHGSEFCGKKVIGGEEQIDSLFKMNIKHVIFGFGNCDARLRLAKQVRAKGFHLATAIHPRSIIAPDVKIGAGTVVVAGAVVNNDTRIGENVIVNTSASIDHDCYIDDGVHICPGVHMGGHVTVGRAAWIGIGATVIDHVNIGAGAIIGAGALVVNDIPEGVVAYGVPARVVRKIDLYGN